MADRKESSGEIPVAVIGRAEAMPRFFCEDILESEVRITGGDARHIAKSLRMRVSEAIEVCDLNGSDYKCRLTQVSEDLVLADMLEKSACKSETTSRISLYQALPKSDKLEVIAQKAVELGVYEITPVLTSRCVSRWDKKDSAKKLERLQKIILEAAKQSGRGIIPRIHPLCGFEEAVAGMKRSRCAILFYERARTPLKALLDVNAESISIMTGSEGGFSEDEARYAGENGVLTASLGTRILRCETAPVCALSAIGFALGEF